MKVNFIHDSAIIEDNVLIGDGAKIWVNVQIRNGAKIGSNTIIGKDSFVDEGVIIGSNAKIQNASQIYKGVEIEDDVFVGPAVTFTNDLVPRAFNQDWKITKTLIKKGASIGANTTVVCGVTIGQYAMIGAGSVITKDIPDFGLVMGVPAKLVGFVDKMGNRK